MKVVCDNCRAVYKIPDEKLVKPVNKATCRNCGHRMLIPRPQAGADPDERTLVTAVPPTPIGAPPRNDIDRDRLTTPMDNDEGEKTLPGRPVANTWSTSPVFGTPVPTSRRDKEIPRPAVDPSIFDEETRINKPSQELQDMLAEPARPPQRDRDRERKPTPAPPRPRSEQSKPPKKRTPAPAPKRRTPTPAPAARSAAPPPVDVAPVYDPGFDMIIAILGVMAALGGAYILAFLSVLPHPLVTWMGLAVATGGGVTALMILLTGGRGRRPAWKILSLLVGAFVGLMTSSSLASLQAIYFLNAFELGSGAEVAMVADATPSLASVTPAPDGGAAVVVNDVPAPAPAPVGGGSLDDIEPVGGNGSPAPSPRVIRASTPSPSPAPSSFTPAPAPAPAPYVAPAPRPAPRPAPAPASGMSSVPVEVLDTMLRSNRGVKMCFFQEMKSTGKLPARVDIQFTLETTGRATGTRIKSGAASGSSLERCLSSSVAQIQFPPVSKSQKFTYPFILQ